VINKLKIICVFLACIIPVFAVAEPSHSEAVANTAGQCVGFIAFEQKNGTANESQIMYLARAVPRSMTKTHDELIKKYPKCFDDYSQKTEACLKEKKISTDIIRYVQGFAFGFMNAKDPETRKEYLAVCRN
jgi:hypothetical protein